MKLWLTIGAILAGIAVLIGAFGAHGLKYKVSDEDLAIFETAVRYHMYHALGIFLISIIGFLNYLDHNLLLLPIYFMITGIVIFSGTLYILVLTNVRWLGAITPIGGLCLIIGWFLLAFNIYRS